MPIHPVTIQPAPVRPVRFGGVADALANSVGVLENNRILELLTTDLMGMCAPRTGIEAVQRGPDIARETAIRELTGLIGNLFLVGWISRGMLGWMGDKVSAYNPNGIPIKAWINARALESFSHLYQDALEEVAHMPDVKNRPLAARQKFIEKVFQDVRSADARSGAAIFEKTGIRMKAAIQSGQLEEKAVQEMLEAYQLRSLESALGVSDLNKVAHRAVRELKGKGLSDGLKPDALFMRERLHLSHQELGPRLTQFVDHVDQAAKLGGLSDEVTLKGNIIKRRDMLEQLKHFLEQGVDRASDGLTDDPKWKTRLEERLFAKAPKASNGLKRYLHKFWPAVDDGLLVAMRKSKALYTTVPIFLAAGASISVAFYNNHLTRKKHGGVNFFPGEGGPPVAGGKAPATATQNSIADAHAKTAGHPPSSSAALQPAPTTATPRFQSRSQGAFQSFQQGGRLA